MSLEFTTNTIVYKLSYKENVAPRLKVPTKLVQREIVYTGLAHPMATCQTAYADPLLADV